VVSLLVLLVDAEFVPFFLQLLQLDLELQLLGALEDLLLELGDVVEQLGVLVLEFVPQIRERDGALLLLGLQLVEVLAALVLGLVEFEQFIARLRLLDSGLFGLALLSVQLLAQGFDGLPRALLVGLLLGGEFVGVQLQALLLCLELLLLLDERAFLLIEFEHGSCECLERVFVLVLHLDVFLLHLVQVLDHVVAVVQV